MGTQEGMLSRIVGKILNGLYGQWTLSYQKLLRSIWSPIWPIVVLGPSMDPKGRELIFTSYLDSVHGI